MTHLRIPVLGFAAPSGSGKTRLLRHLIPLLRQRGLRIGTLKHAHHDFDPDIPGKDSYELRRAGSCQVLVTSNRRWALIRERELEQEPTLEEALAHFPLEGIDLVLVEGFKGAGIPKIEVHRPALGLPPIYPRDPWIIAVASDAALGTPAELPILDLNRPDSIAGFVLDWALACDRSTRRKG